MATWETRVEGRLMDEDIRTAEFTTKFMSKFSSFFKSLDRQLDKEMYDPKNQLGE